MIDKRICPEEMLIGIQDVTKTSGKSYMTFDEGVRKVRLNSETSWRGWSKNDKDPIRVKNKFATGFKLNGLNRRWSSEAVNRDHLLVTHPLHGYDFELNLAHFLMILKDCSIVDGVIEKDLIMTKNRTLMDREQYAKEIVRLDKEEADALAIREKCKETRLKKEDQLIGYIYKDNKNKRWIYLGAMDVKGVGEKYLYLLVSEKFTPTRFPNSWSYKSGTTTYKDAFPSVIETYVGPERRYITSDGGYYHYQPYATSCVKSKKSLSSIFGVSHIDQFADYTEEQLQLVEDVWNRRSERQINYYYGGYGRDKDRYADNNFTSDGVKQLHGGPEAYSLDLVKAYLQKKEELRCLRQIQNRI